MKRMISLTALIICSFTISFGATQTWRLTNDSNNDSLPTMAMRNDGSVWVAWLGDKDAGYDAFCIKYDGIGWSSVEQLTNDSVNQRRCLIANNPKADVLIAAWDSAGYILLSKNNVSWSTPEKVNPTGPALDGIYPTYCDFALCCSDSGYIHVGWSAVAGGGSFINGALRTFKDNAWDTVEIVLPAYAIYSDVFFIKDIASQDTVKPQILSLHDWSSIMGNSGSAVAISYYNSGDSSNWWTRYDFCDWIYNYFGTVGLRFLTDGKIMACCQDYSDSCKIKSYILSDDTFGIDTTYTIAHSSFFQSGVLSNMGRPCVVWSDSQRIYASAFYDSMWSTIPTLISDSSLTNCINPDIVVENDSTMWVCYESNNEIYVTRTSVPLGTTGGRPEQNKITIKPYIHAYPNPASNRVSIRYNNNGPAVISIYDITGGRIRSLTANNGQAVWDCRNGQGQQVSSGVYFIRAKQDNNEIIKKINIVR